MKILKTIIGNLDILVSLTRDFEGFGYSLAEAMAYSVPIISTNVGGSKEFLNKKNANIVKPYDPKGISLMIIDYFQNTKKKWKKKAKICFQLTLKKSLIQKLCRKNMQKLSQIKYAPI